MEERHRLTFETHEEGKLTFEEYLGRLVFYQKKIAVVSNRSARIS
jgi:putative hydrolase of the HAD superfamily